MKMNQARELLVTKREIMEKKENTLKYTTAIERNKMTYRETHQTYIGAVCNKRGKNNAHEKGNRELEAERKPNMRKNKRQ